MPYNIENIFICLAAPFLLAALGTNTGNRKNYIFIVLGFVCCIIFLILQWDLLPLKISVTFWNTEQVICFIC